MKKCLIITAYMEGIISDIFNISHFDYIICADNGYAIAAQYNIIPNLIIGDFDSLSETVPLPEGVETITFPVEKDYTDTMICLQEALRRGYFNISIAGGLGGRFDHTIANIQSMSWAINEGLSKYGQNVTIMMADEKNTIHLIKNGAFTLHGSVGQKFSLLSHNSHCTGINVAPAKWVLENATINNSLPIGISNEFISDSCQISVSEGELLIIKSQD